MQQNQGNLHVGFELRIQVISGKFEFSIELKLELFFREERDSNNSGLELHA